MLLGLLLWAPVSIPFAALVLALGHNRSRFPGMFGYALWVPLAASIFLGAPTLGVLLFAFHAVYPDFEPLHPSVPGESWTVSSMRGWLEWFFEPARSLSTDDARTPGHISLETKDSWLDDQGLPKPRPQ